ncbi:HAMP domain-containing sensor histidine kinase [Desulfovibrio sp. Fe33]|uniref:HAMP domain-containing sensor histidine kinase n=1 Tax=Desulfovibrio sp. Fe33 TaxID=3020842 RepID=UPI00234C21D5|nr:HAMP domain-containing sensor histidine kinase [Desulfovibrio sp. Fe33]
MPEARHLNIATKLTIWSCALIAVFFATSAYLFRQVRQDADIAALIVTENHALDSAIQRMLERLGNVQNNIRRYRILGGDQAAVSFIVEDLTRFGEILNETIREHPRYAEEWKELTSEYEITLDPANSPGDNLAPDDTVRDWTDILEQSLLDNQADLEARLTALRDAGRHAANVGMYGLAFCLIVGVGGSLLLAYTLNRSLTEVRRGIRELGEGAAPRDVRILSGDELGELALAFNAMAARLRREERMRADFIAMLSHEIRTPLTSVREAVDLIGSGAFGEVNEKQKRFLDIAEQESDRLSALLTRLLSVSRLEAQELELAPERMDAAELVASTLERMTPTAKAAHVALNADVEPKLAVRADPEHIRQVLTNLVGNAVKFSGRDGSVLVSAVRRDGEAVFSVADDGPGIPHDEQERIFLKYYREPGVRESIDGAGLGLAISQRIVLAHGGRIWVESEPGRGSVFFFTLPATS